MRAAPIISSLTLLLIPATTLAGYTNNIMLTGYWPPTGEMIRPFSNNPVQNPDGWIGENWRDLGYDVYSFFPEFEDENDQQGYGDFEIDYQDTTADWWRITEEVRPVAIITFSWTPGNPGHDGKDWEIELRNKNRTNWIDDYEEPYQPDEIPPDPTLPPNAWRNSSLPAWDIMLDVDAADVGVDAYLDLNGGGSFLSEYIGYHGCWYHDIHSDPNDPFWNVAAGHIHVGQDVTPEEGFAATEVTLETLINFVDETVPEPSTAALFLLVGLMFRRR